MTQRPSGIKITDIKMVRSITRLLGKFGISGCYKSWYEPTPKYDRFGHHITTTPELIINYGWGLKESKDYVESKYEYIFIPAPFAYNPLREIEHGNQIAQIKCTRWFMTMLNKLGINSADSGLKACKFYTDRLRARN